MRVGCEEPGPVVARIRDPDATDLRHTSVRAFERTFEDVFYSELGFDDPGDFFAAGMV
jgi:hypothetical protein